jgi:two-component system, chemotaxis family, sensor kinase Cph1
MAALVSDLLNYSRVVHEELHIETVDISQCVDEAMADLRTQLDESGGRVTAENLPMVQASRHQMRQVFLNLIGNAVKYRSASESPRVHVSAWQRGDEWLFAVRDNGIGIDPQYFERIFGLFKRLYRDQYPGTGVGLALCKRIVQSHGGSIWVESTPGEGSTFYFTVPARHALHQSTQSAG